MSEPILQLQNLQRQYDGETVLKGISAEVKKGDVIALLGKNGSGKTTLLETILGFATCSFGSAKLWGCEAIAIDGAIKQRIGFVPQQSELMNALDGNAHLALYKAFREHWNQALVDRLTIEWLIPMDKAVGKMSVGQQQKLSILLALAHEPELLVLDEPVASLDPVARRQFLQTLIEVAADEQRAIIFSSHIVSDMERIANQVWMLQDGALSYQAGLDELKESVARVTIYAQQDLPAQLPCANILHARVQGKQATVVFKHWQPADQALIAQQLNAQLEVEFLSLEDIFLEFNA